MECFIVSESDIDLNSKLLTLRGDEARHAVRVLRISEGEQLLATTLSGFCYRARCIKSGQVSKNEWLCECSIEEILPEHNEPTIDVQLVQGIPQQQSKFEEIAERCTEIGIRSIVPIYSKRTEKKSINAERLMRIIRTACKQSHRARMPELHDEMNFEKALAGAREEGRKIILLHESAPLEDKLPNALSKEKGHKIALFIGPEGGFDEAEVLLSSRNYGARIASLGPRRLRAETAAVVAVSLALGT
jgi:16S rRNA (uracil1498-N3)-methyltransferase